MLKWLSGILTTVLSGWLLHDRLLRRLMSWSWHFLNSDISQGSVVTQLSCDEIVSQGFVANLLVNLSLKEVWKSVNIWRRYGQYCSALFFWLTVSFSFFFFFSGLECCRVDNTVRRQSVRSSALLQAEWMSIRRSPSARLSVVKYQVSVVNAWPVRRQITRSFFTQAFFTQSIRRYQCLLVTVRARTAYWHLFTLLWKSA